MQLKSIILLFLLFVCCYSAKSQEEYNPQKKFAAKELIEDAKLLAKTLNSVHPSLYRNVAAISINSKLNSYIKKLEESDSLTEIEFLKLVAELNATIKCVHTDIRPSAAFDSWWRESALLVPFNIIVIKNRFYVYQNYSNNNSLALGSEIHAINGRSMDEVFSILRQRIPSDGNNLTHIQHALRRGFYRYYSYYINTSQLEYNITYSTPNNTLQKSIQVQGISKKTLDAKRKEIESHTSLSPPISLTYIDSVKAALLSVPTFRNDLFEKGGTPFSKYLKLFFAELDKKNTKNLIVDLRNNGGGYSEYGAQLLSYLTDTPFVYCRNLWVTSDTLYSFLEYDIPKTFEGFPNSIVNEEGGYKWKKHSVLGNRMPAKNNFKGNIYFLINGGGASTTSEVASIAKDNKMGVFIGEEVGGEYKGDNGGVLAWLTLPNTKVRARIAVAKYELAVNETNNNKGLQPRHGALPDYYITPTIEEFIENKDPELDFVLQLIVANE
jgi:hypothetical protein